MLGGEIVEGEQALAVSYSSIEPSTAAVESDPATIIFLSNFSRFTFKPLKPHSILLTFRILSDGRVEERRRVDPSGSVNAAPETRRSQFYGVFTV